MKGKKGSKDLRQRAVVMVEEGENRREVARVLNLAPSTAVRWLDRWNRTGSVAARNPALGTVVRRSRCTSSGCSISWRRSPI
jgi:transposase